MRNKEYDAEINDIFAFHNNNDDEVLLEYLKMLVYIIDFRSPVTVTHTIITVACSVTLASLYNLPDEEIKKIYLGALLHDIGKINTPVAILEKSASLDISEMEIMKMHVVYTREIIEGHIDEEIVNIAARHHEKLNGTGYPDGLTADEITFSQRIVAIADIVSALTIKRSYKEAFNKEKVIKILSDMASRNLI